MELCRGVLHFNKEEMADEHATWKRYTNRRIPDFYPGFLELVRDFKEKDGFICVVFHSEEEQILRHYLQNGFQPDLIFGRSYPEELQKPSPYPVETILKEYGLEKREVLVVDDMKFGCQMAKASGVDFAAAGWSHIVENIERYMRVHSDYYFENRKLFDDAGIKVYLAESVPSDTYPKDIALNALFHNGVLYANITYTDPLIKKEHPVHCFVKQGYTRCSVAVLGEWAAITADKGIADALRSNGVDVLLKEPGGIVLDGYDYGFIGGCGVSVSKNKYAFFGNVYTHRQGREMVRFAESHGVEIVSLTNEPLTDYGGGVVIKKSN